MYSRSFSLQRGHLDLILLPTSKLPETKHAPSIDLRELLKSPACSPVARRVPARAKVKSNCSAKCCFSQIGGSKKSL